MSPAGDLPASGPAFPATVKLLATVLLGALIVAGVRSADQLAGAGWSLGPAALLIGAMGVIGWCYYWMLRSITSIDATHIRQTWVWDKEVEIADITQAKFIYVPYLAWLIAPRLVVRVRGRGLFTFHAADRRVLQAFARLSLGAHAFPV